MSKQNPNSPRKRRPIAGERNVGRPSPQPRQSGRSTSGSSPVAGRPGGSSPAGKAAPGSGALAAAGAGASSAMASAASWWQRTFRKDATASGAPGGPTPPAERAGDTDAAVATAGPDRRVPTRVLSILGGVAVVLVVLAAWLSLGQWDVRTVSRSSDVDTATRTAPAAAEKAAAAILSYDYKSLGSDEASAEKYMTPAYSKQYSKTFDHLVKANASRLHAKVTADVKSSGISNADPDRANVLLFVNQTTTSTANGGQPQVALNRVTFSMVNHDGTWLVNNITSY
jgi:Mce-associated membrane protein